MNAHQSETGRINPWKSQKAHHAAVSTKKTACILLRKTIQFALLSDSPAREMLYKNQSIKATGISRVRRKTGRALTGYIDLK